MSVFSFLKTFPLFFNGVGYDVYLKNTSIRKSIKWQSEKRVCSKFLDLLGVYFG